MSFYLELEGKFLKMKYVCILQVCDNSQLTVSTPFIFKLPYNRYGDTQPQPVYSLECHFQ